jgi:hypothetical protein
MAKLIFFDDKHQYEVGGEILPSVSEILQPLSRAIYDSIPQYTLEQAADRGKRVHAATENLDRYNEVQVDNDILPYVEAYVKWRKEYDPQWTRIEYACYHPEMMFAGTLDRYGTIRGEQYIVDIKTTSTLHTARETAQLNGYQKLAEANGLKVDKRAILQLKKDGTFKFKPIEEDDSLFMACYTIHKATEKKKRRK